MGYYLFIIIFKDCPFTSKSLDFLAILFYNAGSKLIPL